MKYELVRSLQTHRDMVIVLKTKPSWWQKLLGYKEAEYSFVGSCTVWHSYPELHRCSTSMEGMLADFWTKIRYEHANKGPKK